MSAKQEKEEKISNWEMYLRILSRIPSIKSSLWWLMPTLSVYIAFVVTEPYFYKLFVDGLEATMKNGFSGSDTTFFVWISVGWIAFVLLSILTYAIYDFGMQIKMNADWKLFANTTSKKILSLPLNYHISTNLGERQKIYDRGIDVIWWVAYETFINIVPHVLIFLCLFVFGLYINPTMMAISLSIIPIGIIVSVTIGTKAQRISDAANRYWDKLFGRFSDGLTNISILRLFAREKHEWKIVHDLIEDATNEQFKVRKLWAFLSAGWKIFEFLGKICVMVTWAFFVLHGKMTIGDLFFFVALASRIYAPLQSLEQSYRNIVKSIADFTKVDSLLSLDDEPDNGKKEFKGFSRSVSYDRINFSYPSNDREVLKNVSFEIKKWEKVAFVGHTGSGKTTLTQLLTRFYEPISGRILVDGTDIREYTLESYRSHMAAVFQDTTLFNDTIKHNLEYVRDNVSMDEIRKACKQANILEFIESLEKGFDTEVGERGLKLSGGEKQRLAIARAIIADPDILILDEATSALDAKTERLVQQAFDVLMEWRTSIIIAHRLSTIRHADRIFLFEKWELIGSGNHDELYASSPVYREMVDFQKNGFVEEEYVSETAPD